MGMKNRRFAPFPTGKHELFRTRTHIQNIYYLCRLKKMLRQKATVLKHKHYLQYGFENHRHGQTSA